jgi:hypothetical protein
MKITSVVPMKCNRRQVLAVFAEVIRIELSEAVEWLDVFHDRDLCGYCSDGKLFGG